MDDAGTGNEGRARGRRPVEHGGARGAGAGAGAVLRLVAGVSVENRRDVAEERAGVRASAGRGHAGFGRMFVSEICALPKAARQHCQGSTCDYGCYGALSRPRRLPQRVHHSRPRSNQRSYGCCEGYITAQRIRMTHFRLVPRQTHPRQRHRVHPGAQFREWLERRPTGRSAAWSPNANDPGRHLRVPNTF